MTVTVVRTSSVKLPANTLPFTDLERFKKVLLRQGLIEPLVVRETSPGEYETTDYNWYDHSYLAAARALDWETVIICLETSIKEQTP